MSERRGATGAPRCVVTSGRHVYDDCSDRLRPRPLTSLAAVVVAGQILPVAAVAIPLTGVSPLTTAALLVAAAPRLSCDRRDPNRRWEPWVYPGPGAFAAKALEAVFARSARVVLVPTLVRSVVLALVLGRAWLTKPSNAQQTAEGRHDHCAAVGLLANVSCQVIEPFLFQHCDLSLRVVPTESSLEYEVEWCLLTFVGAVKVVSTSWS